MQPFFLPTSTFSLFQDVLNSSLLTVSSLLTNTSSPYPLPLAAGLPGTSSDTILNCCPHFSHIPHSLSVPGFHSPLTHTTYQHRSLDERHHSLSVPFKSIQWFRLFLCPSYNTCSVSQYLDCPGVNRVNLVLSIEF